MKIASLRLFALGFSFVASSSAALAQSEPTALVRHAPSLNGTVDGSIQQMNAEGVTLNSGAVVTKDLLVPGKPAVQLNGSPTYAGTIDGTGTATPTSYQITLNSGASLRHVVRRTNAVALPTVSAPPLPAGTRSVVISSSSTSAGNFATLRDLTLNSNVGQFAIPAGAYGNFAANGGSGFTLGVAGAVTPAAYNFQNLTLNGLTQIQLVGPVVITVANGFNANGAIGTSTTPAWLRLNVYSGGFTLNSGSSVYGFVTAPNGTVIVNGNTTLTGGVACDRLTVNGGGLLRLSNANTNHAPVANDASVTLNEHTSTAVALTGSDADNNTLTYAVITGPQHGSLSGAAPHLTYTPVANYHGADTFTFKASDGQTDSNVATIRLTILPVNDAPLADAKTLTLDEDTPAGVILSGTDVDGDALSFSVTVAPAHGSLSGTGANRTYTPAADYAGPDIFSYVATDGSLTSAPANVAITVRPRNDAPVALVQTYSVSEGSTVGIVLTGTDVEGDPLTFATASSPAHGTLTGIAPNLTYRPNPNFGGSDSFTFTVSDGALTSAPAAITINVTDLNFAPVAAGSAPPTNEDTPVTAVLTATDQDGDPLTFSIVSAPSHGMLGPILAGAGGAATVVYTPAGDYNGADIFTFKANDGLADSNTVTVALTIHPVNDAPVAAPQTGQTDEDNATTLVLAGSDVEGSALTFAIATPPAHGSLGAIVPGANGTASVTYTPEANYSGPDSFSFRANDGELDSAPAAIALTINPVNDVPVAAAQAQETDEDVPLVLTLTATDIDSGALTFSAGAPQHGTLGPITPAGDQSATVTYTPAANYHGDDTFSFVASDGGASSAAAVVTLTIHSINDAPVATGQELAQSQDTAFSLTLAATDVDGDALSYALVTQPQHGSLSGTAPNLTYTPQFNYRGDDTLVFRASDGTADSNTATVTFTMTPVSHAPAVSGGPTITLNEDGTATVTLAATDLDGDALTYLVVAPPQNGTLGPIVVDGNGVATVVYTPAPDFHGSDSFGFKANDGASDSNTATVSLTVQSVNDAPMASAVPVSLDEDTTITIPLTATDADGDALSYSLVTAPSHGTLSAIAAGPNNTAMVVYTPTPNYYGPDSFTYAASDGTVTSAAATVSITVRPVNDAPVAAPQTVNAVAGTPAPIVLGASDVDSDPLTYAIVTPPVHGTLSGTAPNVAYTATISYTGADSFTFKVNDGTADSAVATVTLTVAAPTNAAPVVNAGPDSYAAFGESSTVKPYSNIVLNHDEWTLTQDGFAASASAGQFARNLASWFTGGRPGKFLAYTNTVPGSVDFAYTGPALRTAMEAAGHTWVTSSTIPFTLANLKQYDAVFLCANQVDNNVLTDYVNAGGSVYISAGTKWCGCDADIEAGWYNTFLNRFGLAYGYPYNGVSGTLPIESTHPIFTGITSLFYQNGNPVIVLDPANPRTSIINRYQGKNLLALYSRSRLAASFELHGTATDDGLPPPATLTYTWSTVTGPDVVYFDDAHAANTTATFGAAGVYTLQLTASDGVLSASDTVVITVELNEAPQVYAGGNSAVRSVGDSFQPLATLTDDGLPRGGTLTASWRMLSGPATPSFSDVHAVRPVITFPTAGIYVLELTGSDGQNEARSRADIRVAVQSPETPAGIAAWWPGNSHVHEIVAGGHDLVFSNAPDFAPGEVADAFSFVGSNYAQTAAHPDLDLGTSAAGLTVEFWAKPADGRNAGLVQWASASFDGLGLRQWDSGPTLYAWMVDTNGQTHLFGAGNFFTTGAWVHVAFTYDKVTGLGRIYRNGILFAEQAMGIFTPRTNYDLFVGATRADQNPFKGLIDEVTLYRRPLQAAEIAAIFAAGTTGKCPPDNNTAPSVNAGPDVTLASTAATATLAGVVTDDGLPFGAPTVQWSLVQGLGTVDFGNATSAATTARFSASGTYQLKLTGSDGLLLPVEDVMEVRVGVAAAQPAPGIAAWWPANGQAHEMINGGHDVELINGAGYTTGEVTQAFNFDGVDDFGKVPAHPDLDIGTAPAGFTIELWARPGQGQNGSLLQWTSAAGTAGMGLRQWDSGPTLYAWTVDTAGQARLIGASNFFTTGTWVHVAFTYDRVSGWGRIYRNGILVVEQNIGSLALQTAYDLYLGATNRTADRFKGAIDEVTLYRRPLAAAEIAAVYAAGAAGKSPALNNTPPSVSAGPSRVLASTASVASLAGTVSDDGQPLGAPTVQWTMVDGPGAVNFTTTASPTTTATFNAAGTYLLQLTASDGLAAPVSAVTEVRVGVAIPDAPAALADWWTGNGHPHEIVNGNHDIELFNGAGYAPGRVSQGFVFDGADDFGKVPAHADLNLGSSSDGFTIELWAKPGQGQDASLVQWTSAGGTEGMSLRQWDSGPTLYAWTVDSAGQARLIPASNFFTTGAWVHVAFTYDKPTGVARIYRNGLLVTEQSIGSLTLQTTYDLYVGAGSRTTNRFKGTLDEISFYRRPLAPAEIAAIYAASVDGKCPPDDNAPPVVNAGADVTLAGTNGVATLDGTVTDDGKPFGAPVAQWSAVSGPGTVNWTDSTSAATTATFSANGTYLLRLTATDRLSVPVSDVMEVRVGVNPLDVPAGAAAWWPANGHPRELISGNHDVELINGAGYGAGQVTQGFVFDGVDDYGKVPAHADLNLGVASAGLTIELWAKPGQGQNASLVQWTSAGGTEGLSLRQWDSGPTLYAWTVDTAGQARLIGAGSVFATDTWVHVAFTYDKSTGIGRIYRNGVQVGQQTLGALTLQTAYDLYLGAGSRTTNRFKGTLDEVSFYNRPLTAAEITAVYQAGAVGKKAPIVNLPPTVNAGVDATGYVNNAVAFSGTATDDGLPTPPAALTYAWSKVSGPGNVAFSAGSSLATNATFDAVGSYTLRLTASDSVLSASDDVAVTITAPPSQPPVVAFYEPANGATLPASTYFELVVHATDPDGTIAKVEFFQGATKLGEQTAPVVGDPTTYFWPVTGGRPTGSYTFTAKATDNSGVSAVSAPISITVIADPGPPTAEISAPAEDSRVTSPTEITGVVASPILGSWAVDYRLKAAEGATVDAWTTLATGSTAVGTPAVGATAAVPGTLGTFDPTRLINGIYELRLAVTDTAGRIVTDGPITVVVEGNMKIGAFTLAFEDLKVPVAGLPITLTRTYDSRDTRVGDFGPGWRLALANIRVQKNRNLGAGWWQTPQQGSGIQFYDVLPIQDRIVTIVFPDGETHRFKAGAYVKVRPGDPDYRSFAVVVTHGKYRFYPVGDTTSKLEPLDASNQLAEDFWIDGTGDQDLRAEDPGSDPFAATYNTTRFRLTTKDGAVYLLDETIGLLRLTDQNGNTLVPNRDAQNRVSGVTSTQNAPGGPIVTSVTVHRDATGRVDYIRDPANRELDYSYDPQGRLASFTNRELNVTQFRYENAAFPYYLTKIIDPRGVTALRSEFDADGRMIKQIDADGKETVFNRGADATGRFEKVKDRLNHETTFYYDDRGNVTLKIDPLGAQTSYSYYPDGDRVKFETDHYGNVKSFAYDAHGNAIVETIGASASEDPASPTTGYTTRTSYNDQSAPTQITDPDGRVQTFSYDPTTNNLLTQTMGAGGSAPSTTTYTYNSDGTLTTITDALGNVTSYAYDTSFSDAAYPGAVKKTTVTITDPAGDLGSDPSNGLATVLRSTRTLYDAQENQLAQIVTRTLPDGSSEDVVTRHRYDTENRLAATIQPDGRVMETRYNAIGKEDKVVLWQSLADYQAHNDATGRSTSYGYDDRGNQTSVTYADGAFETAHFDAESRKDWSEDRKGQRTTFEYDAVGRLRFTTFPGATHPKAETVYDLIGRVTDSYDELRHHTQVTYYPDGAPGAMRRKQSIQVLTAGNLVTSYQYDQAGNVRFVTDPRGNSVETRYDEQGRPRFVIYPATDENPASQTETKYDQLGRRIEAVDQDGKVTRYRYDGLGRLAGVTQFLAHSGSGIPDASDPSKVLVTSYTYDELGNQQTQTDALGRTTTYWADPLGRRTKRVLPKDATESTFLTENLAYDGWGDLWKRTDFAGKVTTFTYDALNRLKSKAADATHPSLAYSHAIARIEYDYDANGARTAARTYNQANTLLYTESTPRDERGRLDYKDTALGRLDYDYFDNGLLKDTVSSNAGGVNLGYRYDEANRLEHVDDATTGAARTTTYGYNANGSLETVTYPNAVAHAYVYDTLNRLRTLNVTLGATTLHAYEYKLKPSGHRWQVIEGTKSTTYTYDDLHRLTGETVASDPHGSNGAVSYDLDKVGNRLNRVSSIAALTSQLGQSYNARDWLAGDTYTPNGSTVTGHLAPLAPGLLPEISGTDTYDFEEHLIVRQKADGSSLNVSYDADGNRCQKTLLDASAAAVKSTTYLVDANNVTGYAQVVEERTAIGGSTPSSAVRIYTYGSYLISRATSLNAQPFVLSYYAYDGHGSVRELTDAAGGVTDRYDYDAFGNLVFLSGSTSNAYLYCGEQFDTDLGLYFLRARYLNPDSGRFWWTDRNQGSRESPVSLHKFIYSHANPSSFKDRSGFYVDPTDFLIDGIIVHRAIGRHFVGGDFLKLANYYTIGAGIAMLALGPEGKAAALAVEGIGLKPDLIDIGSREVWEIKTERSFALAAADLAGYLYILNEITPDRSWRAGISYVPPPTVTGLLGRTAYVRSAAPGIILYTPYIKNEHIAAGAVSAAALYALSSSAAQAGMARITATVIQAMELNLLAPVL